MVKLGTKVSDSITGFTGIATCRTEYLYGCVRIGVEPEGLDKDGLPRKLEYFDEQRLTTASPAELGGPQSDPPPRETPR